MSKHSQTGNLGVLSIAVAVLIVMAVLALASFTGATNASHACVDGTPGPNSSNLRCGADNFAIDMDPTGNTATSLGTNDQCARIDANGVQDADEDAVDTLTIDVTATNITAANPLKDFAYSILYDPINLTFQSRSNPNTWLASTAAGSSLSDASVDPAPDDDNDFDWDTGVVDLGAGTPYESGSGVLDRVSISGTLTAPAGQYPLFFDGIGTFHVDTDNDTQFPDSLIVAAVAVNQACGVIETPTPSPTPSPTPTPTPTPPPTTSTPPPTTPTPTPTPRPVPVCPGGGNDGFEAGLVDTNAIPCWTVTDQTDGSGSWCNQRGTLAPGGPCAGSFASVAPPPELLQAAMTGQGGPGSHLLYRCGFLSAGPISFQLYLDNEAGQFFSPASLDFSVLPNQQFRADLVSAGAMASRPFTVDPLDVRLNLYQTQPGDPPVSGYVTVSRDAGGLVSQNLCIRFAEVDNQFFFVAGVDDVRIGLGAASTPTPTPTVAPGFHDASVKRLAAPASVHLLPGAADTTGSFTTVVVANESDHSDTVGIHLAFVPPFGASNPGGCSPGGVITLGVVTLLPGKSITLKVDPEWLCENPSEVDGLPWTLRVFADIHADDGASCATLTQVFNGACSAALANDDDDDIDNAKTRPRPRVVALTP